MTRTKAQPKPLPTIWEIPDELWRRIEPILREFWPGKATGRKVANWRKMLNGIIFRMRSGCQWEKMPERYGPKSTVHDWFQRWVQGGIFEKIWPTRCWARPGSGGKKTGKNPTDRGKKGTKKSLLTDGDGGPLGVVIAGANVVEQKLLKETIEAIVVERPDPDEVEQNLCLDKGYDNPRSREAAAEGGYVPHIRRIGEEKKSCDRSQGTSRVAGWGSGRSHGCRSAEVSWCGGRRRTATISG
jgi:putative transposase